MTHKTMSLLILSAAVSTILTLANPAYSEEQSSDISEEQSSYIRSRLNEMFGRENWFCFPGDQARIGISRVAGWVKVESPLSSVETSDKEYSPGTSLRPGTSGTAVLMEGVTISKEQCPQWQQAALAGWDDADALLKEKEKEKENSFREKQLDKLFDRSQWKCASEENYYWRVYARIGESKEISFPIKDMDHENGTKYGLGMTAEPGGGTFTLAWTVDCNYQPPKPFPERWQTLVAFAAALVAIVGGLVGIIKAIPPKPDPDPGGASRSEDPAPPVDDPPDHESGREAGEEPADQNGGPAEQPADEKLGRALTGLRPAELEEVPDASEDPAPPVDDPPDHESGREAGEEPADENGGPAELGQADDV